MTRPDTPGAPGIFGALRNRHSPVLAGLLAACVAFSCSPAVDGAGQARPSVTIAAAANLQFALDELVAAYLSLHPEVDVRVSYGSSGNFYAQLQQRAPFDIFLSADSEYPRRLTAAGLGLDEAFVYATGRIVVWVPHESELDLERLGIEALAHPSVQKVAIANPAHAPYGRAAVAALASLGVHQRVESRIVLGENVSQTAQFVQSGAADIGVISLALALAPQMRDRGRYWEIPLDAYPTVEQGGAILSWAGEPDEARRLRDFMLSEHGRELLEHCGFFVPERR